MPVPREELADRLRARRAEIEQALLARTSAVQDTATSEDPEYLEGFRAAVRAAFDYSLAVIESGEGVPPPIPAQILTQARLAARNSVGLDSVLRRYIAGSALVDDFILSEIGKGNPQEMLRIRTLALELLLSKVSAEHQRELARRSRCREARAFDQVRRLLRGEPLETSILDYDLSLNHVGLVARGPRAKELLAALSTVLDSRLLVVRPDDETVWAWIGRRRPIDRGALEEEVGSASSEDVLLTLGEPLPGITGWRSTHHQARAALLVALRGRSTAVYYRDVCLLAAALRDPLLVSSLRSLYLQPLELDPDGGMKARETLRAYFRAHRNGSSTAAILGISRQAVTKRLRAIENRVGRPLDACYAEMELALSLPQSEEALSTNS